MRHQLMQLEKSFEAEKIRHEIKSYILSGEYTLEAKAERMSEVVRDLLLLEARRNALFMELLH